MRKYVIDFRDYKAEFALFHRLIKDATAEISRPRVYLPNPTDLFEGENSLAIYRLGLIETEETATSSLRHGDESIDITEAS